MSDTQTADSITNLGALPRDIIARMTGVEIFEEMLAGRLPAPPIMLTMEMKLREAERGRAVFSGTPSVAHMNPQGSVHGGWISTILDSALTCAVHTDLEAGELCTTTSLTVNMVRPLMPDAGEARCEGRVVHRGRRLATAEGSLLDANGKLIAHGTANCMIFGIGQ
jgi:uncharacterized protein (TIGR00369 family)